MSEPSVFTGTVLGIFGNAAAATAQATTIPLYLYFLGTRGYAVIAFATTVLATARVFDLGISTCVVRGLAGIRASESRRSAIVLMNTFEALSISIAIIAATLTIIITHFSGALDYLTLFFSEVQCTAIAFPIVILSHATTAFLTNYYIHCLLGLNLHRTIAVLRFSESASLIMATLIAFCFFNADTTTILCLNASVSTILCILTRSTLAKHTGGMSYRFEVDTTLVKDHIRFAIGVTWVNILAIAMVHADRFVLLRYLKVTEYGQYCIANASVAAAYGLVVPAFANALMTRFSSHKTCNNQTIAREYRFAMQSVSVFAAIAYMSCELLASTFLAYLLKGNGSVSSVTVTAKLIASGYSINAIMVPVHYLLLSRGHSRVPANISTILASIFLPSLVFMSSLFGQIGAAANFFMMNMTYFLIGIFAAHRIELTSLKTTIFRQDIFPPFAGALTFAIFSNSIMFFMDLNPASTALSRLATAAVLIAMMFYAMPDLRYNLTTMANTIARKRIGDRSG